MYFLSSFFIPQKRTYPYLFKYKLNCRPTTNKTSVPQGETHGKTPVVNLLSATTIEETTSQSSNPKPSVAVASQPAQSSRGLDSRLLDHVTAVFR